MFRPQPNQRIQIGRHVYRFLSHPATPAFPYGQEGRMAVVYKLVRETPGTTSSTDAYRAFKVFKASYRSPQIEVKARDLKAFAQMPGLQACTRKVISPRRPEYRPLLQTYPDLEYAVLMPWVPGETWGDIMLRRHPLSRPSAWNLAWAVLHILMEMEKRQMAHCDLAAANLMVDWHNGQPLVALVDVEQLYAPGLSSPEALLVGSPGYMPHFDRERLWGPLGDRFAGAILLAEILAWYDPEVARHGNEQSYFRDEEMHTESERYRLLVRALEGWSPSFAELFRRAWFATSLEDCPPLSLWHDAFQGKPIRFSKAQPAATPPPPPTPPAPPPVSVPPDRAKAENKEAIVNAGISEGGVPPVASDLPTSGGNTVEAGALKVAAVPSAEESPSPGLPPIEATEEKANIPFAPYAEVIADTERVEPAPMNERSPTWESDLTEVSTIASLEENWSASTEATVLVTEETAITDDVKTVNLVGPETGQEDATQMMGLEDEDPLTAFTAPESASPEERLRVRQEKARKYATLGLLDQALDTYRRAIDLAAEHRLTQIETLLNEYNQLLFRQLDILEQGLYQHAALGQSQVKSFSAAQRLGYWLGGLPKEYLVLLLMGAALASWLLMMILSPLVHHPFWATFSLGAFLLALLLPALRRPPVITGVFTISVAFGLLGVRLAGGGAPAVIPPLLAAALGSGLASWLAEDVFRFRLPKNWPLHMLWSVVLALLVGMTVDEIAYPATLGKFSDPNAWLFNLLLAFTGWYLGYQLQELVLAFREASGKGG